MLTDIMVFILEHHASYVCALYACGHSFLQVCTKIRPYPNTELLNLPMYNRRAIDLSSHSQLNRQTCGIVVT